jgi:hypothetical protein
MRHFLQKSLAVGILAQCMGTGTRERSLVPDAGTLPGLFSGQASAFAKAIPVATVTGAANTDHNTTTGTIELAVTVLLQKLAEQALSCHRKSETLNASS